MKRAFHDSLQTDKDDEHEKNMHNHIASLPSSASTAAASTSGEQSDHKASGSALSEQDARDLLQKRRSERLAVMKSKEAGRQKSDRNASEGEWINAEGMVRVTRQRGKHIAPIGTMKKNYKRYRSSKWLLPEEALFLVDQGHLVIRHKNRKIETLGEAYSLLLSSGRHTSSDQVDTVDLFVVYSYLKRLGFIVHRHESASELWSSEKQEGSRAKTVRKKKDSSSWFPEDIVRSDTWPRGWWDNAVDIGTNITQIRNSGMRERKRLEREERLKASADKHRATIPLIDQLELEEGDEIDLRQLYRALQIVGTESLHGQQRDDQRRQDPGMRITYDFWKPGTVVSSKKPMLPMGSIVVVRANDKAPSLSQIDALIEQSPAQDKSIYFAIVEDGGVTFLKQELVELTNIE